MKTLLICTQAIPPCFMCGYIDLGGHHSQVSSNQEQPTAEAEGVEARQTDRQSVGLRRGFRSSHVHQAQLFMLIRLFLLK